MNIKKLLFMITMLLLLSGVKINAFAESRNIYVGDIITLEITTLEYSEDELKEKFQDFEIVEIEKMQTGYSVSIRTFDVGDRTILLGDKEIVISVASTLDDISRDDIFEGEAEILKSGNPFYWRIIFYVTASIFVLSGGFVVVKFILKKKYKPESAYQLFLQRCDALSEGDDNYFVKLTFYFKEYIESLHNRRIIGKTSTEIVSELKEIPVLNADLSEINKWLMDCDIFKFSGAEVSSNDKNSHYEALLKLVKKIEMNQCEINEGTT